MTSSQPSRRFTDSEGTEWLLDITLGDALRLKKELGVDLGTLSDGALLVKVASDDELFVQCLWTLCEAQADRAGIEPEAFAQRLGGNAIADASRAFEEAVVFFTRNRKGDAVAAAVVKVIGAQKEAMDRGSAAVADEALEHVDAVVERAVQVCGRQLRSGAPSQE